MKDTRRLCLHTVTTRPWSLERAVAAYARAGVGGITVWRQALADLAPTRAGQQIRAAGLEVVSLCRGGFFPAATAAARQQALDENRRAVDEAAALGAPLLVLVCGALPGQSLARSRQQIADALAALLPHAADAGVRLGVEPLHPMYAANRSAINTLHQANDLCDRLDSAQLGVVLDVYHLWWDPELASEIDRCGRAGRLFAFHVSDWKVDTGDLLYDRGLMGEGCIPLRQIRDRVEAAGFSGYHEVEIFSDHYWAQDQATFLDEIVAAYLAFV